MLRTTRSFICVMGFFCALPAVVQGAINLELRPMAQTVILGNPVNVGLYAVSDSPGSQLMAAADVILGWDPNSLLLLGNDNTGAVPLFVSGFPATDPYGLNEAIPPQDGDGLYLAWAQFGQPVAATPSGTLLTTFRFQTMTLTTSTQVHVLPTAGNPEGATIIYDGTVPLLDVTGTLGAAAVRIVQPCSPTVGDVNEDSQITYEDVSAAVDVYLGIDTTPSRMVAADANCDNLANGLDIQPLVDYILLWL